MEHVRPAETSVNPIYIRTSTLLIAAGNITTLPCYNLCPNYIISLFLEMFLLVRLNLDQSPKPMKILNI